METNKNFPLPETCKELGEAFPEWETHNATIYNNGVFDYVGVFFELKEDTDIYPAPSFQELWEMLPDTISNGTYEFDITKDYVIYWDYDPSSYEGRRESLFEIPIMDNHVTEAMAQMLLTLKREEYLNE